jgi:hypothetical protein
MWLSTCTRKNKGVAAKGDVTLISLEEYREMGVASQVTDNGMPMFFRLQLTTYCCF